jgi:hypothetical protein
MTRNYSPQRRADTSYKCHAVVRKLDRTTTWISNQIIVLYRPVIWHLPSQCWFHSLDAAGRNCVTLHSETLPLAFWADSTRLCGHPYKFRLSVLRGENDVKPAVFYRLISNVQINIHVRHLLRETIRNVPYTQPLRTGDLNVAFSFTGFVTGVLSGRTIDTVRRCDRSYHKYQPWHLPAFILDSDIMTIHMFNLRLVHAVMTMKSTVFWDVPPWSPEELRRLCHSSSSLLVQYVFSHEHGGGALHLKVSKRLQDYTAPNTGR